MMIMGWVRNLLLASAAGVGAAKKDRRSQPQHVGARTRWNYGLAPLQLPHCRDVEVVHVPKTSGTALVYRPLHCDLDRMVWRLVGPPLCTAQALIVMLEPGTAFGGSWTAITLPSGIWMFVRVPGMAFGGTTTVWRAGCCVATGATCAGAKSPPFSRLGSKVTGGADGSA